jgi:septum formation inhibitor-activating ATPase MinD
MEQVVKEIVESYETMIKDAKAQIEKGNKTAGTRARKASLELEKLLKDFRKKSIEAAKQ